MYAAKESTTALTKASLASERLDETERSTAVGLEGYKKLLELTSFIPLNFLNINCALSDILDFKKNKTHLWS